MKIHFLSAFVRSTSTVSLLLFVSGVEAQAPGAANAPAATAPAPAVVPAAQAPTGAAPDAPVAPAAPGAAPPAAAPQAPPASPEPAPVSSQPAAPPPVIGPIEPGFAIPAAPAAAAPTAEVSAPAPSPAAAEPGAVTASFHPGAGLDVTSGDGRFSLNAGARIQVLNELRAPAAGWGPTRDYTVLRQVRLMLSGNVFSKDIRYRLELGLSTPELGFGSASITGKHSASAVFPDRNGSPTALVTRYDVLSQGPVLDAYVDFTQLRDANLHVGQSKVPFGLEELFNDGGLQPVDRSIANTEFGFDRDIGVDIRSSDFLGLDRLSYYLGIYSGEGRNASLSSVGGGDLGFTYVGRVEIFPLGIFDNHFLSDTDRSSDPRLAFGLAYAFSQMDATSAPALQSIGRPLGAPGDAAVVDYNTHNFTADALFHLRGFSAMTAFHYRKVTTIPLARTGIGWTLQSGYVVSDEVPLEIAAQLTLTRPVDKSNSSLDKFNELGGGLNYYIYGHGLKLQAEYVHTWTTSVSGSDDNRVRVQLQAAL